MEYTRLGNTGLEVSTLCLGTMNFGSGWRPDYQDDWTIGESESIEVIRRAIDAGINFIDTANMYSTGGSEEIVGKAIEGRRDEVVLATKVGNKMADRPNGEGLSRKHVLEQAEASLDRLDTDYIDLYYIHRWPENTPLEETLSALQHLVDEGAVRYLGASNLAGWQLTKALYTSDLQEYQRFVCVQPRYNLVARQIEEGLLPACRDQGIGVVPYSPLERGFLTGKYTKSESPEDARLTVRGESPNEVYSEAQWAVLDEVRDIADAHDVSPVQISLAWQLHNDDIDAPIIGPKSIEQLEENIAALDISLSNGEIDRLEAPLD